jgi:RHS repeat-associated protein
LFNGNIRHVVTAIDGLDIQGYGYKYDQLQRLVEMQVFRDQDLVTNNNWNGAQATDDYKTNILYDKNGNILKLRRNGYAGAQLEMDNMNYYYHTINGERSNRLNYVEDAVQDYSGYDDIKQGQSGGNYSYNRIGELTGDFQEGMELVWRYGDHKLKEVIRYNDNSPNVEYIYDPLGTRVAKIVKPRQNGQLSPQEDWEVHYYAYNGQGQVMAIYESKLYETNQETHLKERYIYGVERHGHIREHVEVYNNGVVTPSTDQLVENTLGKKRYELKSYNDNVHVVITDRKVYDDTEDTYEAVIVQQSDYYAFGMLMPNRNEFISKSRFGFANKEMDDEIKGSGNHYNFGSRIYDPRTARFFSLDPQIDNYPSSTPYSYAANNPIAYSDVDGEWPCWSCLVKKALPIVSVVLDFVPIVGQIKSVVEAAVGYSMDGTKLSPAERGLALLGVIPGAGKAVSTVVSNVAKATSKVVSKVAKPVAKKVTNSKIVKKVEKKVQNVHIRIKTRAEILKENKARGKAYEKEVKKELESKYDKEIFDIFEQPTVKLPSGGSARPDFVVVNKKDKVIVDVVEAKTGNAKLSKRQKQLQEEGGVLSGKNVDDYMQGQEVKKGSINIQRKDVTYTRGKQIGETRINDAERIVEYERIGSDGSKSVEKEYRTNF